MKKLVILIIAGFLSLNTFSNPIVSADTLRIDGKLVLWLRADNYGNGWNYGYFLGNRIMSLFDNYVIPTISIVISSQPQHQFSINAQCIRRNNRLGK